MRKLKLLEIESFVKWYGSHSGHFYVTKAKTFELDQLRLVRAGLKMASKWFVEEDIDEDQKSHYLSYMHGNQSRLDSADDIHTYLVWSLKVQLYLTFLLQKARFISRRNRPGNVYKTYESIFNNISNGMSYDELHEIFGRKTINDYSANDPSLHTACQLDLRVLLAFSLSLSVVL